LGRDQATPRFPSMLGQRSLRPSPCRRDASTALPNRSNMLVPCLKWDSYEGANA
jgi:hypothetical protein